MRIDDASENQGISKIVISHNGDSHVWSMSQYARTNNVTVESIFELLNQFVERLPMETQAAIYQCYVEAWEAKETVYDDQGLHIRLTKICNRLYKLVTYDQVSEWRRLYGNINVPNTIVERYQDLDISERNQPGSDYKSRTYLKKDYLDTVDLGILLKFMIPIWSEYMAILQNDRSNTTFKEYQAMSLLSGTHIVKIPTLSLFRDYISHQIGTENKNSSAVLGGLGSSDLPDWLMSIAIIRRLVIIPLSTVSPNQNIVSVMYYTVDSTLRSMDRKFKGRIREKPRPANSEDADNKSVLETYKMKQDLSDGDLAVLSVFIHDIHRYVSHLDSSITKAMINKYARYRKDIDMHVPTEGQFIIIKWISSLVLPPRSIDHLSRKSMLNCRVAASAFLWNKGFYDLALLMTGSVYKDEDGHSIGGSSNTARIPSQYVEGFEVMFPYYQKTGSKSTQRQMNVACKAIDMVAADITNNDWIVNAPEELCALGTDVGRDAKNVMPPPANIKQQLSELVNLLVADVEI